MKAGSGFTFLAFVIAASATLCWSETHMYGHANNALSLTVVFILSRELSRLNAVYLFQVRYGQSLDKKIAKQKTRTQQDCTTADLVTLTTVLAPVIG